MGESWPSAPDLVEPIIGYRAWSLRGDGALVPWSLSGAGPWRPGVNEAECHIRSFGGSARTRHDPPDAGCMCGLYALANHYDRRLVGRDGQVVGAIVAWGAIALHRTGYRAAFAQIVALAETDDQHMCEPLKRAAARYDVPIVPRDLLPLEAARWGSPIASALYTEVGRQQSPRPARHSHQTGYANLEHLWARPDGTAVTIGLARGFLSLVGPGAEISLPPAGTQVEAGEPLGMLESDDQRYVIWSCVSGQITYRNEAAINRPETLYGRREDEAWLVDIDDSAWSRDVRNFEWGPRGATSYTAHLAQTRVGIDVFSELRATRLISGPRLTGLGDVLRELDRRLAEPRFRSAGEVYAVCAEPLRERLTELPALSERLARLGVSVRFETSSPSGTMTLAPRGDRMILTCGSVEGTAEITLTMSAETAAALFAGEVDLPRALRAREIVSSAAQGQTLRTIGLVKELFASKRARR